MAAEAAEVETFEALGLPPWLLKQCKALNFSAPTPVQANCVAPALEGADGKKKAGKRARQDGGRVSKK